MKNKNLIFTAIIALAIGLGVGYFLFGKYGHSQMAVEQHDHSGEGKENGGVEEWICSMHPQIRQNEPGLCPICEMDLIPAGSNNSDDPLVLEMTENAVNLSNIQTTVIGTGSASEKNILLNGKIKADERRAASQVVHIPGRIEKLFVSFTGEPINTGQKLATIYSPELITAQKELLEAVNLKNVNADLLEAAKNKLRYWKISDETIQQIENDGKIKETITLYAESSGIVSNRRVSVGDYVKQGQVLFEIINLNRVWVFFDAYEEDLANIKLGNKIEFTTPAAPGKKFTTTINFIDPIIDPNTRAASIRGEVPNSGGQLKPEMFVKGTVQAKSLSVAQLSVPKSAVLWTGKRSVAYVKLPAAEIPSFQFREIEIGEAVGNNYLVLSGLEAGEEVVTHGNFVIDAAAQLNNQTSMMNKNVGIKKESVGVPDYQADTPIEFKQQLKVLTESYLNLKDAFVETNASAAAQAAARFMEELKKVDMGLLKGEAHLYWMTQLNGLENHGDKIASSNDVEEQRKQFSFFSDALINSIKAFGTSNGDLFVQYCPMAIDNTGADWIATEEEIRNPYFGDKMMKCGTVKTNLSANNK